MLDAISNSSTTWLNDTLTVQVSDLPRAFQTVNVAVRLIEGLMAVVTNSLTILAIIKYDFLKTNTNLLISNLAAGDLLGGLSPAFLVVHYNLRYDRTTWLTACAAEQCLNMVSVGVNIIAIMWVSLDRFLCINFPLRYYSLVQPQRVWAAIAFSWISVVSLATLVAGFGIVDEGQIVCKMSSVFYKPLVSNLTNAWFFLNTLIIIILYTRIAYVACRQARRIGQEMNAGEGVNIGISKNEKKITKMMTLVLGVYIACYMPQMAALASGRLFQDTPLWLHITERCFAWAWWINSWMNPFIYAWKSREFNRGFRLLLGMKTNLPSPP